MQRKRISIPENNRIDITFNGDTGEMRIYDKNGYISIPIIANKDYNELENKPSINSVVLTGDKTFNDLNLIPTTGKTINGTLFIDEDNGWSYYKVDENNNALMGVSLENINGNSVVVLQKTKNEIPFYSSKKECLTFGDLKVSAEDLLDEDNGIYLLTTILEDPDSPDQHFHKQIFKLTSINDLIPNVEDAPIINLWDGIEVNSAKLISEKTTIGIKYKLFFDGTFTQDFEDTDIKDLFSLDLDYTEINELTNSRFYSKADGISKDVICLGGNTISLAPSTKVYAGYNAVFSIEWYDERSNQ